MYRMVVCPQSQSGMTAIFYSADADTFLELTDFTCGLRVLEAEEEHQTPVKSSPAN